MGYRKLNKQIALSKIIDTIFTKKYKHFYKKHHLHYPSFFSKFEDVLLLW